MKNDPDRAKPIAEYVIFWSSWVSYYGKCQLSLAGALVTFVVSVMSLYLRPLLLKRVAAITLFLTLALVSSAAYDWYRFHYQQHGVVISDETIARKGDSDRYEPA
ncbi:MAG: hypothetical protein VCB43_04940, partial [Myxococcota bacterium]